LDDLRKAAEALTCRLLPLEAVPTTERRSPPGAGANGMVERRATSCRESRGTSETPDASADVPPDGLAADSII
jgi:hypothetical protein